MLSPLSQALKLYLFLLSEILFLVILLIPWNHEILVLPPSLSITDDLFGVTFKKGKRLRALFSVG